MPNTHIPSIGELRRRFSAPGRLVWIGVRPTKYAPLAVLRQARLAPEFGIEGDRRITGPRQLTLIQQEHLGVIAALCDRDAVDPADLRRNLVITDMNIIALKDQRFFIGGVELLGTGTCPPCSRMEQVLGQGGFNAMRGHGGITARVLNAGQIELGDRVAAAPPAPGD